MIVEISASVFLVSLLSFLAFVLIIIFIILKLVETINKEDDDYQNVSNQMLNDQSNMIQN